MRISGLHVEKYRRAITAISKISLLHEQAYFLSSSIILNLISQPIVKIFFDLKELRCTRLTNDFSKLRTIRLFQFHLFGIKSNDVTALRIQGISMTRCFTISSFCTLQIPQLIVVLIINGEEALRLRWCKL